MNDRDLRALVYAAHAAKGDPGPVARLVDAWTLEPLIDLELALLRARRARVLAEAAEAARVWETDPELAAELWGTAEALGATGSVRQISSVQAGSTAPNAPNAIDGGVA